jgi:predicted MPP superfamily phosphohydrolase
MRVLSPRLLPLEFGSFGPLQVRQESIALDVPRAARILYASDLHLGHWWTRRVADHLLEVVRATEPDLVLLGGDLVDHPGALNQLASLVRLLTRLAPVHAIPGNHDERVGIARLRATIEAAAGHWLPDRPIEQPFRIDGRIEPDRSGPPRVLCAHYPSHFPAAVSAGYQLVLAGHLHGGQCVLATRHARLYPAAWFHRWHGLRFSEGGATLLVSRGVADTLPLRFNCPREVLLCQIGPHRTNAGFSS